MAAISLTASLLNSQPLRAQPVPTDQTAETPVSLASMARSLRDQLPALLKKYRVAGVQATLFDPHAHNNLEMGMYAPGDTSSLKAAEAGPALPVAVDTLFEVGELNRPVIAVALIEALARKLNLSYAQAAQLQFKALPAITQTALIKNLPLQISQQPDFLELRIVDVVNHTSGLPLSRPRILGPASVSSIGYDAKDFQPIYAEDSAGMAIRQSAAGYALLFAALQTIAPGTVSQIILKNKGLYTERPTCVKESICKLARPMVRAAERVFWMDHQDGILSVSDTMLGTAGGVAAYLSNFMKRTQAAGSAEHTLLERRFQYHPDLGGMVAGLHYLRLYNARGQETILYTMDSRRPGFSAVAFVTTDGRGLVLLSNSDRIELLYYLMHGIWQEMNLIPRELPVAMPSEEMTFFGSYRPVGMVPDAQFYLRFLSDITLFEVHGRLEMQSVFQKKTGAFLWPVPDKPDLFLEYGPAPSHGWRLRAIRDTEGDVIALESDLLRYERVSRFASGWAIIVYLALVLFACSGFVFYLLWRRLPERG